MARPRKAYPLGAPLVPWGGFLPPPLDACERDPLWLVVTCEAGHEILVPTTCDRLDCAACADHLARRRGGRAAAAFGGAGIGAWVFTIPRDLRQVVGVETLAELRRRAADRIQAAYGGYGRIGVVSAVHPTGSICGACGRRESEADPAPLGVSGACASCGAAAPWVPHLELLVPLRALTPSGEVRSLPGRISPRLLDAVRGLWTAEILHLARSAGVNLGDDFRAVVHYRYMTEECKVAHRFRYSLRPFSAYSGELEGVKRAGMYGLCAPNASGEGVGVWRCVVSAPRESAERPCCPVEVAGKPCGAAVSAVGYCAQANRPDTPVYRLLRGAFEREPDKPPERQRKESPASSGGGASGCADDRRGD